MTDTQRTRSAAPRKRPPTPQPRVMTEGETRTPPPANMNMVGQSLRLAREQRGEKVEDIAETLKIRRVYLQALEDSDWANLPELVYAQGFVRSYADYLGLDGPAAALQFKKEFRGGPRKPELDMPKPIEDNQTPDFKIIGASIAGLLAVLLLWSVLRPSHRPEPVPPAPSATQSQPAPAEASAPAATTEPNSTTAAPAAMASTTALPTAPAAAQTGIGYGAATQTRVTITATQDSWVQVRASDGQVMFSRVMRPGDYYRVPPDAGLTLTTGNLSGLNFTVDGQNLSPNSTPGTVQRNLTLAPDGLLAGLAPYIKSESNGTP